MKVRILDAAERDLQRGYWFYEPQEPGLGDYFLDSLYADIDALKLYGGIHRKEFGYHRSLAKTFPFFGRVPSTFMSLPGDWRLSSNPEFTYLFMEETFLILFLARTRSFWRSR